MDIPYVLHDDVTHIVCHIFALTAFNILTACNCKQENSCKVVSEVRVTMDTYGLRLAKMGYAKMEPRRTDLFLRLCFGSFQSFAHSLLLMSALRGQFLFSEPHSPFFLFHFLSLRDQLRWHHFDAFKQFLQLIFDCRQHLQGADVGFVVTDARTED